MKKILKKIGIVLVILIVAALLYVIGFGFIKESSIYVRDYKLSEDGTQIDIEFINCSSIGFIRKGKITTDGNAINVDFYRAFGGVNGSIGAMDDYVITIDLNSDTDQISFNRGNSYEQVLVKNNEGNWVKPEV